MSVTVTSFHWHDFTHKRAVTSAAKALGALLAVWQGGGVALEGRAMVLVARLPVTAAALLQLRNDFNTSRQGTPFPQGMHVQSPPLTGQETGRSFRE